MQMAKMPSYPVQLQAPHSRCCFCLSYLGPPIFTIGLIRHGGSGYWRSARTASSVARRSAHRNPVVRPTEWYIGGVAPLVLRAGEYSEVNAMKHGVAPPSPNPANT